MKNPLIPDLRPRHRPFLDQMARKFAERFSIGTLGAEFSRARARPAERPD